MTKPEDRIRSASPTSSTNNQWVSASQQALLDLEHFQRYGMKSLATTQQASSAVDPSKRTRASPFTWQIGDFCPKAQAAFRKLAC